MNWDRLSRYCQRSAQGHTVSAAKTPDGWRYVAWSPTEAPEMNRFDWLDQMQQVHYPLGEPIRQRSQMLGVFESAEAARACCESSTLALEASA